MQVNPTEASAKFQDLIQKESLVRYKELLIWSKLRCGVSFLIEKKAGDAVRLLHDAKELAFHDKGPTHPLYARCLKYYSYYKI